MPVLHRKRTRPKCSSRLRHMIASSWPFRIPNDTVIRVRYRFRQLCLRKSETQKARNCCLLDANASWSLLDWEDTESASHPISKLRLPSQRRSVSMSRKDSSRFKVCTPVRDIKRDEPHVLIWLVEEEPTSTVGFTLGRWMKGPCNAGMPVGHNNAV